MNIDLFLLCDAATHAPPGKLNVLGTFDTIHASQVPTIVPHCAVAARIRFSRYENGEHNIRVTIIDADGHLLMPPLDGKTNVQMGEELDTVAIPFVINMNNLSIPAFGTYAANLTIDGTEAASTPFYVKPTPSA